MVVGMVGWMDGVLKGEKDGGTQQTPPSPTSPACGGPTVTSDRSSSSSWRKQTEVWTKEGVKD